MLTHQDARQIVMTSAEPGDGKSTVVANLAVCFAQAGKRTLLIDADMRRPGLSNLMKMRGARGLSEVLRASGEIGRLAAAHINTTAIPQLDILPSGPRPADPAELLTSPRFSQLLAWAETVYDQVLIDSPPALAAADAAVMGRVVDGVLVLVQPAKNRRRAVMRAVERLALMKIPILGLVVNRAGSKEDRGYYDYDYGYGVHYDYGAADSHGDKSRVAGSDDGKTARSRVALSEAVEEHSFAEERPALRKIPRRVA
jgi:capsular exopolysaccharide synthesis family protein